MPSGPKKRRAAKNKEAAAKHVSGNNAHHFAAEVSENSVESSEEPSLTLMNNIVSDASINEEPGKVMDASLAPQELSQELVNGKDDEKASKVINECCIASPKSVEVSNDFQICNNGGPSEGKAEHISCICVDNVAADSLKGDDNGPEEIEKIACIAESEVIDSVESVEDSTIIAAANASIGTPVAADAPKRFDDAPEEIEVTGIAESEVKVSVESVEDSAPIAAAVQTEILELICQKDDDNMTEQLVPNNEEKDAVVLSEVAAKDTVELVVQKDYVKVVNGNEITCDVHRNDDGDRSKVVAELLASKIDEVVSSMSVAHGGRFITHIKLMLSAIGLKDSNEHYGKLMELVEQFEREAQEFKAVLFMLRELKMSAVAALTT
ncbi:unnamed protein product [Cuscuta europaea]|uniref:Uncharacterized protein n=1 Tax=Cuscuta europaea TaxID=41803 RepID=A0A9P0Z7W4_CUSEU|nr:unnamed protein product [Cuscuta europaea]